MGESDPLTLLGETLAPRLALAFMCGDTNDSHYGSHIALLGLLMAGLPLDGIVTFAAQDLCNRIRLGRIVALQQFWFHISPKFYQVQRVRLSYSTVAVFIEMLLEDSEGRERPLFPSMTELILVNASKNDLWSLCDSLIKRVEQGVPLEVLDLRMCFCNCHCRDFQALLLQLSEIVVLVHVLSPESYEAENT